MQQNRRRGTQKKGQRQLYDQAKDTRRAGQSQRASRPRTGYQEQTISFETAATPQRRRADNSVEFPSPDARRAAQNSARRQNPQNRPQSAGRQPRPANRNGARPPVNGRMRPTQATMRGPVRREKRQKRRLTKAEQRRRRFARRLTAFLLLVCVIAVGMYLTVTMLFKINTIQVQAADGTVLTEAGGYTGEQILQALGVQLDDNIFSFDPAEKAEELEKQFPLLEQISVVRRYPTSVYVRVTESVPTWAMQTENGVWLTLSSTLKILSQSAEQPALPTLYGGEPLSETPGDQLEFAPLTQEADSADSAASSEAASADDGRLEALNSLITALENQGLLADVTRIEFADTEELAFLYQDRISVLLGTLNGLDYKMDFAQYLLLNTDGKGCGPTDTGRLDCSHMRTDGTLRPILAQGEPTLPSGYVVSAQTQTEEAPAEETSAEETPAEETSAGETQQ